MTEIEIILLVVYVVFLILYAELAWLYFSQEFLHWKRDQGAPLSNMKKTIEKVNRSRYFNSKIGFLVILSVIFPVVNVISYFVLIYSCMTNSYKFSNKYIIQDICSWRTGITYLVFKNWSPSEKWKKKYPIE